MNEKQLKQDVMTTKDWLKYLAKFLIPGYNIYWIVICIIGNEKTNENERNYTLASMIYCGICAGITIILMIIMLFVGSAFAFHFAWNEDKNETEPSTAYEEVMDDKDDDDWITEDNMTETVSESEDTADIDIPVQNVLHAANEEINVLGITFISPVALTEESDDTIRSFYDESGDLSVYCCMYEDTAPNAITDDITEELTDGQFALFDDPELETYNAYGYINGNTVNITIYYTETTKQTAEQIMNSLQKQ